MKQKNIYNKVIMTIAFLILNAYANASNYAGQITLSVGETVTVSLPYNYTTYMEQYGTGSYWTKTGNCFYIMSKSKGTCDINGGTVGNGRLDFQGGYIVGWQAETYECYWDIIVEPAKPKYGDTFSAKTPEGVDMLFKIINVDEKLCEVGTGANETPAINKETEGAITIPQVVSGKTSDGISVNNYTVSGISKSAFYYCEKITSVNMPNTIGQIRERAFYECNSLQSINFSSSLSFIGEYAFYSTVLETIDIPNSVTTIGKDAFCFCNKVKSISLGKSVKSIGDLAFYQCSQCLTSIMVAGENTTFDSRNNCNALIETATNTLILGCQNTTIPNTVKIIGKNAFGLALGLRHVDIPNSVTTICEQAFYGCIDLVEINIPNSVTTIENSAFSSCSSVNTITLPNSLTSIGKYAFAFNRWLKTVKSNITNPFVISDETFKQSRWSYTTLYVPAGTSSRYDSTNGWKLFSSIKEGSPEKLTISCNLGSGDVPIGTEIILSSNSPNAEIYYTIDGVNSPGYSGDDFYTSQCLLYKNPIKINQNCTIMAIACLKDYEASNLLTEQFNVVEAKPDNITLPSTMAVTVGETVTLTPTITPSNAVTTLTWSSDDETIATVDSEGVVTGIKKGQTFINVETDNGKTAYCKLTVTALEPIGITISPTSKTIEQGEKFTATYTLTPSNATTTVTWSSDNESVATVTQEGVVTGVGVGSTVINVKTANGKSASCTLTVTAPKPIGITISPTSKTIEQGETFTATYTLTPSNAQTTVTWSSDNESIATVTQEGVVTGVGVGSTFINVETANGKSAYCKLTVTNPQPIEVSIPKSATVNVGETITLMATLTPANAVTTLTWQIDDPAIATVDANGKVTGIAEGLAIIKVSTANGLTSNACKLTVNPPSGIEDVTIEKLTPSVFSLSGQRLAAPRKGINIIGGKKVVIK